MKQSFLQSRGFMFHREGTAAFTLIELLVVIAIIAILAGMLLPALSDVKEVGKKALCFSNQKQFAVLHASYVNTYDDFIVPKIAPVIGLVPQQHKWSSHFGSLPGYNWSSPDIKSVTWELLLASHISNWKYKGGAFNPSYSPLRVTLPKVFFCPNGVATVGSTTYRGVAGAFYDIVTWSCTSEANFKNAKRLSRIKRPGHTIFLADNGFQELNPNGYPNRSGYGGYVPGTGSVANSPSRANNLAALTAATYVDIRNDYINGRHKRSVNYLFQDGHSANIKADVYYTQLNSNPFGKFTD